MKNILLFFIIFLIIPITLYYFLQVEEQKFIFNKNTTIRVYRTDKKKVEIVPLEEYIEGVIAGEMPVSFNIEALKAQAVAARSYVMYKIIHNKNKEYDVVDTVLNQVYLDDATLKIRWKNNYDNYKKKVEQAVAATAYEYITYNGEVANAMFFSTSDGYTENSEDVFKTKLPYLRRVKSTWDSISPSYQIKKQYTKHDFCKKLLIPSCNEIVVSNVNKTKSGRVNSLIINNKYFTGSEIVKLLSLKSIKFTINVSDNIIVTTHGYGHGVGMSQYGAEAMAREGYKYNEILAYYYKNVKLEKIK